MPHQTPNFPAPDRALENVVEDVAGRVRDRLRDLFAKYHRHGRVLTDELSIPELVDRMVAAVPEPSDWNEAIGPFYRTGGVARLLGGISRQALDDRRKRRTLLALRTSDGEWVYPAFQFGERGQLVSGLTKVLSVFDPNDVDGWTLAGWLRTRRRALGGRSVIEWLSGGGEVGRVRALARGAAQRFAR